MRHPAPQRAEELSLSVEELRMYAHWVPWSAAEVPLMGELSGRVTRSPRAGWSGWCTLARTCSTQHNERGRQGRGGAVSWDGAAPRVQGRYKGCKHRRCSADAGCMQWQAVDLCGGWVRYRGLGVSYGSTRGVAAGGWCMQASTYIIEHRIDDARCSGWWATVGSGWGA